jgi:hypothetical protein
MFTHLFVQLQRSEYWHYFLETECCGKIQPALWEKMLLELMTVNCKFETKRKIPGSPRLSTDPGDAKISVSLNSCITIGTTDGTQKKAPLIKMLQKCFDSHC